MFSMLSLTLLEHHIMFHVWEQCGRTDAPAQHPDNIVWNTEQIADQPLDIRLPLEYAYVNPNKQPEYWDYEDYELEYG